jgi:hypothetical protein
MRHQLSVQKCLRLTCLGALLLVCLLCQRLPGEEPTKLAPWSPETTLASVKLSAQGHLLIRSTARNGG